MTLKIILMRVVVRTEESLMRFSANSNGSCSCGSDAPSRFHTNESASATGDPQNVQDTSAILLLLYWCSDWNALRMCISY
jgi:hypothetical protein